MDVLIEDYDFVKIYNTIIQLGIKSALIYKKEFDSDTVYNEEFLLNKNLMVMKFQTYMIKKFLK